MGPKYIVFDLDDTLTYEIDFLQSAYKEIAFFLDKHNQEQLYNLMIDKYHQQEDVFGFLVNKYPLSSKEQLLKLYRNHFPKIQLIQGVKDLIEEIKSKKFKLGLITDGRSLTQRNKLKALAIEDLFDRIVISEEFGSSKPDERNFKVFMTKDIKEYVYVGDNTSKDFLTPNALGWTSICLLDAGKNIHKQDFELNERLLPHFKIRHLSEISKVIFS